MRETRIPRLLEVKNYLNHYYAMYKRLTRSGIRVELASRGYFYLFIYFQKIFTLHYYIFTCSKFT